MAKITANKTYAMTNEKGELVICVVCPPSKANLTAYDEVKNIEKLDVEIKKHREHRSNSANGKLWVLLDMMAEKLDNGQTKEELYKGYVREYGVFDFVNITDKAVETFIKGWNNQGLGWSAEVVRDSTNEGSKVLVVYYGSSIYDSKQMYRLLREVCRDCEDMGIPTMSPQELKRLCEMQGE